MLNMKQFGLCTIESKMVIKVCNFPLNHFQKKDQDVWDLFGKSDTNAYFLRLKGGK